MLNQVNTRRQGDVGVAVAIAFFTSRGDIVSIPLGEHPEYDVIVDVGGVLKRVQVKTTRSRQRYGRFQVSLVTKGGNQSWSGTSKCLDNAKIDLLFVLTADGGQYCIEANAIGGRKAIVLGSKYASFKVA